jgi:predicted ATPase
VTCDFCQRFSPEGDPVCGACVQPPCSGVWTLRSTTVVHFILPHLDNTDQDVRTSIVNAVIALFIEHGAVVAAEPEATTGVAAFRERGPDDDAITTALACCAETAEMLRLDPNEAWEEAGAILELRGGIATGLILVNEHGEPSPEAGGMPTVIARRLAKAAGPDEILVDECTVRSAQSPAPFGEVNALNVGSVRLPAWRLDTTALPRRIHAGRLLSQRSQRALIGRERELARVQEAFEKGLESSRLQRVAIVGERGSGRGRFIDEASHRVRAAWQDTTMTRAAIRGRDEMTVPFQLRQELVTTLLNSLSSAQEPEAQLTETLAILSPFEAALNDRFVRDRLAMVAGIADMRSEAPTDPDHASEATYVAVATLMRAAAQRGGLVLAVHDLSNAGPDHRRQLLRLLDGLRDLPVLVLFATAPGHQASNDWTLTDVDDHSVKLAPLTLQSGTHLLDQLLGRPDALQPELSKALVEQAEGLPLVLEQLLAALGDSDELKQDPQNAQWHIDSVDVIKALPRELQQLFSSRLDRVDEDELVALCRAAIVGSVFWRGLVEDLGTRNAAAAFRRLEDRGFIRKLSGDTLAGEQAYGFTHPNLRPLLIERTNLDDAIVIHSRTARWITTHAGEQDMRWTGAIAWHFRCGGDTDQSASYDMQAGRWAHDAGDLGLAIEHFERAHRDSASRDNQMEALLAQGESLLLARRPAEAHPLLDEAAAWIDEQGDPSLILRCLGARVYALGAAVDLDTTQELLERALPLAESLSNIQAESQLLLEQARTLLGRGHHDEALETLDNAQPKAEASGDALIQARLLLQRGRLLMHMGQLAQARTTLDQVATQAIALHHEVLYELAREGKAWVALAQGEVDEGDELFTDGARVFRRLGSPRPALRCAVGLAHVAASRGTFTEAANQAAEAYDLAVERGEPVMEAWALSSIAWIFGEVRRGKHKLKAKALSEAALRVAKIDLGEQLTHAMSTLNAIGGGPGLYRGHATLALAEHLADQHSADIEAALEDAKQAVRGFETGRLRIRFDALVERCNG